MVTMDEYEPMDKKEATVKDELTDEGKNTYSKELD